MIEYQLGVIETKFAEIIWENEPISSAVLSKICLEKLGWKKSTTYTVLKRLCDKGIFTNCEGAVTSLIKKEEFYALQSERFVETTFGGSLPKFLAAFTARKTLTKEEVEELKQMIENYGG